ncbi:cytochrome P450 [Streptomyces sp. NPDC056254]|uniref:cytochrome P450 family protein n=1 Tax=Streptomyces sp. NPDC056254 TaxID=3345763 RepID=UPI0035DA9411
MERSQDLAEDTVQVSAARCPVGPLGTPFDAQFFADPYATYRQLHTEGPVHHIRTPDGVEAWLVTRFAEVRQGLGDHRLVRHVRHAKDTYHRFPLPVEFTKSLVREDPPEHTRLRRFMNMAFAPKRVRLLRPRIVEVAERLVDELGEHGETELMSSYAAALPIEIIADMLDIAQEDRTSFRRWADVILGIDPEEMREGGIGMLKVLTDLIERKRAEPGDDIWTEWIEGKDDQGGSLDQHELIGMGFMVLLGGYDPTAGVIGCAIHTLLQDPALAERLRKEPELMADAVEEFLRMFGSNHTAARRFAAEDVELGGVTIPAGDTVLLSLGAADRDALQFDEPDTFDMARPNNRHVAFGFGPHYCPGTELARIQIAVALEVVLRRLPDLKLTIPAEDVRLRPAYFIRSPVALPVSY